MKAVMLSEFGGPEKLELRDVETPRPGRGEVLVKVHASAVNPVDLKIRAGLPIGPALPAILGADLAGTVVGLGEDVAGFKVGDQVYGCAGGVRGHGGTLAEYIAVDGHLLAAKPRTLGFREAAALPLVSITAWEACERLLPKPGEKLLVYGGAGGVGHVAVQLAKHTGAWVAATVSSPEDAALIRNLGADETIDYKSEPVADYVARLTGGGGFDAVIDTVGGENLATSFEAAAVGARIATTNARIAVDLSDMHSKALSLHVVFMLLPLLQGVGRAKHGRILSELAGLVDSGVVRPVVDPRRFTLATAGEAHSHLASGMAQGKIVVDID